MAPKKRVAPVALTSVQPPPKRAKPEPPSSAPIMEAKAKVGVPPGVLSRFRGNKLVVDKIKDDAVDKAFVKMTSKTPQPEDHPSEEEPISSQEYEREYVQKSDSGEDSEDDEDGDDDEESESEDESSESDSDEEHDDQDPVNEIEFPCNIFIPARRFGGKTNAIELILQERGEEFDQIFIIGRSDATKEKLKKYGRGASNNQDLYHLTDLSDEFLKELLKDQKKNKPHTLLVFDDATGMKFNLKTSKEFEEIISSGRNENISCIFGVQVYKKCLPDLRDNSEYKLLGLNYQRAAEHIATECGNARTSTKDLREILTEIDRNNREDYKSFFFMNGKNNNQYMWEPRLAN